MRDVLEQLNRVGADGVSATLQHAVDAEEKRMRCSKRVSPDVCVAFAREQERDHQEFLQRREKIRSEFAKDKVHKLTIAQLIKRGQELYDKRIELQKASTSVECMKALKRWNADDLGQGHIQGGMKQHFKNRAEVLQRLRLRAGTLPAVLENDWNYFVKHWDRSKVTCMRDHRKDSWGSRFLNMMKELASKMASATAGSNPFAEWMRAEMRHRSFGYAGLRI